MSELIFQFINNKRLTTGRRLYTLRRIREVAVSQGRDNLNGVLNEAITSNEQTYKHELAWRRTKELPKSRGNAVALDLAIDRILGGIYRQLEDFEVSMGDSELAVLATTMRKKLFPSGLQPVVQQTFEEQLSNDQEILTELKSNEESVKTLGLTAYTLRLSELVPQFETELEGTKKPEVSWDQLVALRDLGEVHLRRVIAAILSTGELTPADETVRAQLMAPLLYQLERVAKRNAKSGPVDIDPDTGDEVPDPAPETQQA